MCSFMSAVASLLLSSCEHASMLLLSQLRWAIWLDRSAVKPGPMIYIMFTIGIIKVGRTRDQQEISWRDVVFHWPCNTVHEERTGRDVDFVRGIPHEEERWRDR